MESLDGHDAQYTNEPWLTNIGEQKSNTYTPTRYTAFFEEVESFVIVDPMPGRLADNVDGLFTIILKEWSGQVRNGPIVTVRSLYLCFLVIHILKQKHTS
jgi:hypothetical protein